MHRSIVIIEIGHSPSPQIPHRTPESPTPRTSLEPIVNVEPGETSQLLPEVDILAEGPTPNEDGNFVVQPSLVRQRPPPANGQNPISLPAGSPSASACSQLRVSHAKLRSLPDVAVELDSDGEEMSSDTSFSVPATSQGISMSRTASSYLDLIGTLPSAVGDFLDMIDADNSSNT
jgi:hypothetical protein